MHDIPNLQAVESCLKIAALVGAGGFFLWKALTGWLLINMKMTLALSRERKDEQNDYLVVALLLDKGLTDSIWLQRIGVKVTLADDVNTLVDDLDFSDHTVWLAGEWSETQKTYSKFFWGARLHPRKQIALAPSESLQMAKLLVVSANIPVLAEAVAWGKRPFWGRGFQWRASSYSLPNKLVSTTAK